MLESRCLRGMRADDCSERLFVGSFDLFGALTSSVGEGGGNAATKTDGDGKATMRIAVLTAIDLMAAPTAVAY